MHATIKLPSATEHIETADSTGDEWILWLGSAAGIVGSLVAMVGNLLHPATPVSDPEGVARTTAESLIWVPVHVAIVFGLILMLGGLIAIARSIQGGMRAPRARFGSVAAVAGVSVGVVLVIMDGVAAEYLAGESINFSLAAVFDILFAGPHSYSSSWRWLGAVRIPHGWAGWPWLHVESVFVELAQAYTGESVLRTRIQ